MDCDQIARAIDLTVEAIKVAIESKNYEAADELSRIAERLGALLR